MFCLFYFLKAAVISSPKSYIHIVGEKLRLKKRKITFSNTMVNLTNVTLAKNKTQKNKKTK